MGLIIDSFCGGGGASIGIERALNRYVDIAINHSPDAILMHKTNHPRTKHYIEDIWAIDPQSATQGEEVDLAWFSPDCTHFSKAKGSKPKDKKIRGLAWVAVKWAQAVKPKVIILENVEEFKTWGPLDESGYPINSKKGTIFIDFIEALKRLRYEVEYKELRACDYGSPTTRKRFFLIARCDDEPIRWPEPTHGEPETLLTESGILKPYRTAGECIDWSIPCPSIFDRKKPLAENTLRRIARGFEKFVMDNPSPFIVRIGQTGFGGDGLQYQLDKPLTTITSKAEHCLVTPFLTTYYTETSKNEVRGQTLNEPLATIPTANRFGLVTAFLLKYYGADTGQRLDMPLHTITSKDRFGLVTIKGEDYKIVDIGLRMLQPHELFKAQGFPDDYIIDQDYKGNKYSKSKQTARVGNSVCPDVAEALVRANVANYGVKKQEA